MTTFDLGPRGRTIGLTELSRKNDADSGVLVQGFEVAESGRRVNLTRLRIARHTGTLLEHRDQELSADLSERADLLDRFLVLEQLEAALPFHDRVAVRSALADDCRYQTKLFEFCEHLACVPLEMESGAEGEGVAAIAAIKAGQACEAPVVLLPMGDATPGPPRRARTPHPTGHGETVAVDPPGVQPDPRRKDPHRANDYHRADLIDSGLSRQGGPMPEDLSNEVGRNIPLSEMIQTLRTELKNAIAGAEGDELRFAVGEVELELEVVITRETAGGGGVKFWVINAEGKTGRTTEQSHTFKLKLKPQHRGGQTLVSDSTTENVE